MIRLAHFSDIHLISPQLDWRLGDWFSKRFTSWLNYRYRGRARQFALADQIVPRLMDELVARRVDHLVFSGDATVLGFESEVRHAANSLRVDQLSIPGLAVPGNHDYLTHRSARSGAFERHFAAWQVGERADGHCYPFAQRAGPVWLIGVNAAIGNRLPWDARGRVGADQLTRLQNLLARVDGVKVLVIHYPVCVSTGSPESRFHALHDVEAVAEVARAGGVKLWLHGHRHTPYYLQQPAGLPFPVICSGAATQHGIWSYGEYTIKDNVVQAVRRTFDQSTLSFRDAEEFTLRLV